MRVLMTLDAVGGVWRYGMDLADGLARRGHRPIFAGFGPPPSPGQRAEAEALGVLDWCNAPLEWMVADAADLAAVPGIIAACARRHRADLLHLNMPGQAAGLDLALPVVVASHSCVRTWFAAVKGTGLPPGSEWQARLTRAGFDAADAVVAPSRSHADALTACYGPIPRLQVVHNASRAPAGRGPSQPVVAAAARWWDEGKDAATLDAAAARCDWPVRMAGPLTAADGVQVALNHAAALGPLPHDETLALVQGAGVFVSPSLYEPFGLAAVEAARAGVPLVLSDIPTYRELWEGAALFFPPRDAAALAAAVNRLARHPDLRARMGAAGRAAGRALRPRGAGRRHRGDLRRRAGRTVRGPGGALVRFVFYTHSLVSDWNHGNAHFLRGVMRELQSLGHAARALEPERSWSRDNLLAEQGKGAVEAFHRSFPMLRTDRYGEEADHADLVGDADVVVAHEWTDPALIARLGALRDGGARFTLLFHDTHHRAVSAAGEIGGLDLSGYDGVLAFGETLRERYLRAGWGRQVFTWHEAADVALFHPLEEEPEADLVWIGNWGDGERSAELAEFLVEPVRALRLAATVRGVRYPDEALARLEEAGITYGGWIANAEVPREFARHRVTVHVPRAPYVRALPGIPTIRMFEALACGIPLVSAPWDDCEGLFRPGTDHLRARDGAEMRRQLAALLNDAGMRREIAEAGLRTIRARHTCRHRAEELLTILAKLGAAAPVAQPRQTERTA